MLLTLSNTVAFCCKCSFSNNRNKEITPTNWLSTMCEFLFTSYRQQYFYPWLSSSWSKWVWKQPGTSRLTASRAQPHLELFSFLLRLAKSHTTDVIGYYHRCVTVSVRIRDSLCTTMTYCCPWVSPGHLFLISDLPIFSPPLKVDFFFAVPIVFFCSKWQ